jgi:hypothetical protein
MAPCEEEWQFPEIIELNCGNRGRWRVVGTSSFLDGFSLPIQQPLLPLSFRLRRKPRQHQWRGLFETRCGLSRADWLKHLVHA